MNQLPVCIVGTSMAKPNESSLSGSGLAGTRRNLRPSSAHITLHISRDGRRLNMKKLRGILPVFVKLGCQVSPFRRSYHPSMSISESTSKEKQASNSGYGCLFSMALQILNFERWSSIFEIELRVEEAVLKVYSRLEFNLAKKRPP